MALVIGRATLPSCPAWLSSAPPLCCSPSMLCGRNSRMERRTAGDALRWRSRHA